MITIVLRYGDAFAPEEGTIEAHRKLILKNGYVWYGKMGLGVSQKGVEACMSSKKVLLIHSGKYDRYWLTIETVSNDRPANEEFPSYYADKTDNVKTWFKVTNIETAEKDVVSKCQLVSNGRQLNEVSKSSMSPYFIVKYEENI